MGKHNKKQLSTSRQDFTSVFIFMFGFVILWLITRMIELRARLSKLEEKVSDNIKNVLNDYNYLYKFTIEQLQLEANGSAYTYGGNNESTNDTAITNPQDVIPIQNFPSFHNDNNYPTSSESSQQFIFQNTQQPYYSQIQNVSDEHNIQEPLNSNSVSYDDLSQLQTIQTKQNQQQPSTGHVTDNNCVYGNNYTPFDVLNYPTPTSNMFDPTSMALSYYNDQLNSNDFAGIENPTILPTDIPNSESVLHNFTLSNFSYFSDITAVTTTPTKQLCFDQESEYNKFFNIGDSCLSPEILQNQIFLQRDSTNNFHNYPLDNSACIIQNSSQDTTILTKEKPNKCELIDHTDMINKEQSAVKEIYDAPFSPLDIVSLENNNGQLNDENAFTLEQIDQLALSNNSPPNRELAETKSPHFSQEQNGNLEITDTPINAELEMPNSPVKYAHTISPSDSNDNNDNVDDNNIDGDK